MAKKVEPIVTDPTDHAGDFVVVVGDQPVFSSSDKTLCELEANRRKLDALKQGADVTDSEHLVQVGQNFLGDKDRSGKGYIKF